MCGNPTLWDRFIISSLKRLGLTPWRGKTKKGARSTEKKKRTKKKKKETKKTGTKRIFGVGNRMGMNKVWNLTGSMENRTRFTFIICLQHSRQHLSHSKKYE